MPVIARLLLVSLFTMSLAAAELPGLWKARKPYGMTPGVPLILRRAGNTFTADFLGRSIALTTQNGELAFDTSEGKFRAKIEQGGEMLAHWIAPPTPVNGYAASPVAMRRESADRWSGVVAPMPDEFTFYLLIRKNDDGTYAATLRNPERDWGTQQSIDRVVVEGNAVRVLGKRGELGHGTFDAENDMLTIEFVRGGVFELEREGDDSNFYPRGKHPAQYAYRAPIELADGWPVSTLAAADIDVPAMEKLIQRLAERNVDATDAPQIHALLIARHGKLVLEEYFHGHHRDKLHDTRSAGKSLTAIIAGAAIHGGVPLRLSSPVYETMHAKTDDPRKRAMTLADLLTMSGGYFCDDTNPAAPGNEELMEQQQEEGDYYRFTLNVPMATPPGENSVYCSGMANLALGVVGAAAGESPLYVFDRLVARPMQIQRYSYGIDRAGNPYGGGSVKLLSRDFIKLGQLMLNGGVWNKQRVLDREFAAAATSPLYNLRNIGYGYLYWNEDLPYKDRMVQSYSARGAGGQTVTVIPQLGLVVATMAGNYSSSKGMRAVSTDLVFRSILPAVREPGDDKDAPVVEREYTSPYGPSTNGSRRRPPS